MTNTIRTDAEVLEMDIVSNAALNLSDETDALILYRIIYNDGNGYESAYMMPNEFAEYLKRRANNLPTIENVVGAYRCTKEHAYLVELTS